MALQIGHRVSVDFDFFSQKEISRGLLTKAGDLFNGLKSAVAVNNKDELTIFVDGTKITWLYYPYPVKQKLVSYREIPLLSIGEIGATKSYTIGRRGEFKDYVDLYFILSEEHASLQEIIKLAEAKYKQEFNARLFLEQLTYLDDLDEVGLQFLSERISKKKLADFFERAIRQWKEGYLS